MAVLQRYKNMDEYFMTTSGDKIIINDLDHQSMDDISMVNSMLLTVYDSNTISTVPECDCGELKHRHRLGRRCSRCGTLVKDPQAKRDPLLWMEKLKGSVGFLNIEMWLNIRILLGSDIDGVRWLTDSSYNPKVDIAPHIVGIYQMLGVRSYSVFVERLDDVFVYMLNHTKFKNIDSTYEINIIREAWRKRKDVLVSKYIPLMNKKFFVMENTNMGKFTNLAISDVIDLVMTWIKASSEPRLNIKRVDNYTAGVMSKLSYIYADYYKKFINGKKGIARKHIFAARSYFTFRNVITSISGRHKYNEIHAPWVVGVTAFRPHLINKLIKNGFTHRKASKLLFKSVNLYDPLIARLLDELIEESPFMGIPVIGQRNPSLLPGSAQLVYITKFKRDPYDKTVGLSVLIVKAPNADFDGDELNFIIMLDNAMAKEFQRLSPFYNIPSLDKPYSVSGNLTLLSPSTSILNNYLSKKLEDIPSEDTISSSFALVDV